MKTFTQDDFEKITKYRKKHGGTISMAAVKTGAKLSNYIAWASGAHDEDMVRVQIEVPRKKRDAFNRATKKNGTTMSYELRQFIYGYRKSK